jgi:chromosome condensin MukBEF ATPase and DNA-binding subunit MukB
MIALIVPRQRLRILGAPPSVFNANSPQALTPALDAYYAHDYERAGRLAEALLSKSDIDSDVRRKATQLVRAARELQESIAIDLDNMKALIEGGKFYQASLDIAQLEGFMQEGDARLTAIEKSVFSTGARVAFDADKNEYTARIAALRKKHPEQVPAPPSKGE